MLNLIAGFLCGILSGFGIGGGSLLMLWMTLVAGIPQRTAQGVNLLYFLPTAFAAVLIHQRRRAIDWRAVLPAAVCGCITAGLCALLAGRLDTALLRRLFGGFLLAVGASELLRKR